MSGTMWLRAGHQSVLVIRWWCSGHSKRPVRFMNNKVSSFHLSQNEEAVEKSKRRVDSHSVLIKYCRNSAELSLCPEISNLWL